MGYIYKATYKMSGKAYIGLTTQPILKRLRQHRRPSSGCRAIRDAIKKHGWENFDVEWYECPDEELNDLEEYLVEALGTLSPRGYNLKGGGGSRGKPSVETRQKISESLTGLMVGKKAYWYGRTLAKDHRQKISKAKLGRPMSNETKKKISNSTKGEKHHNYGNTLSNKTKQKISAAHRGRTLSNETKEKLRKASLGKTHTLESKKKMSKAKLGKTHTKETKQKISAAHTGKTLTKEHKEKIRAAHIRRTHTKEYKEKMSKSQSGEKNHFYGKTHTLETKKKISEALSGEKHYFYGKTFTKEHKEKISAALVGKRTGAENSRSKKVHRYDLDGTYIDSFDSAGDAARALGTPDGKSKSVRASIGACANGKRADAHGFKWSREKMDHFQKSE